MKTDDKSKKIVADDETRKQLLEVVNEMFGKQ
jgi:hypothetical protein